MHLYKVKVGTTGDVYFHEPNNQSPPADRLRHKFVVRTEQIFESHEMIFDPVAQANGRLKKMSRWCQMQAKKGFAGFTRKGFILVVWYNDVEVM
jgi:hypothetical protein